MLRSTLFWSFPYGICTSDVTVGAPAHSWPSIMSSWRKLDAVYFIMHNHSINRVIVQRTPHAADPMFCIVVHMRVCEHMSIFVVVAVVVVVAAAAAVCVCVHKKI